jgi:hypothetical protein
MGLHSSRWRLRWLSPRSCGELPRSTGGKTEWSNVVSACDPCNLRKANRVDMRPLRTPLEPTSHQLIAAKRLFPPNYLHESWLDYLYWDSEIED